MLLEPFPLRHRSILLLAASLAACAPTQVEPPGLVTLDMISVNGLSAEALEANTPALEALGAGALDAADTTLADSEDGQTVFGYLAGCALAPGESASLPLPDGTTLFAAGKLGFAPGWREGAIDPAEQRWVSACVIAHVNAFEIHVPLSVRAAIMDPPTIEERDRYEVQEAAFYGDLFAPDPADRHMNACFGYDVAAALGYAGNVDDDDLDYLSYRICSTSDECGFNRAGACFDWGPPIAGDESRACEGADGSLYVDCHDRPVDDGPSAAWAETVTVHLQRVDFDRQLAEYLSVDGPCGPLPAPGDAGVPGHDAGTSPSDGGGPPSNPSQDAGLPLDGGGPPSNPSLDAGLPPRDGGGPPSNPSQDAGLPPRDGGTPIHALRTSCPAFE